MNRANRRRQQKEKNKTSKKTVVENATLPSSAHQISIIQNTLEQAIKSHSAGQLAEAENIYNKILGINPDHPVALNMLGLINHQNGKYDIAEKLITKAIQIKPNYADAHNNLGTIKYSLGRVNEAAESFYKTISLNPSSIEAHNNLCEVLEKANRTEDLRTSIAIAKKLFPNDLNLSIKEAQLLRADGKYKIACTVLEKTIDFPAKPRVLVTRDHLLGEIYDRLGETEKAFQYFTKANEINKKIAMNLNINSTLYQKRVDHYANNFTLDWISGWAPLDQSTEQLEHIFLVGFPRSGTTLLDTILRSHRQITVIEEKPTLHNIQKLLSDHLGGDPNGLSQLSQANCVELRRIYFSILGVAPETLLQNSVIIDKMPLNIVDAGHIYRLFPKARFIFVERHPCDCVLSCFMQNFIINKAMANFMDIENAATLYDKVMKLWTQHQKNMPLTVHSLKYEDLIKDFEGTISGILNFLNLTWDENIQNYTKTAQDRERIKTASYNQVIQPLYSRATGRWKNYQKQLEPILPILQPWVKHFGYDE